MRTEIEGIGNYYGGLSVRTEEGKFYWSIENYDGDNWEEIPEYLYMVLIHYNNTPKEIK
jgi:hypothetical protein